MISQEAIQGLLVILILTTIACTPPLVFWFLGRRGK